MLGRSRDRNRSRGAGVGGINLLNSATIYLGGVAPYHWFDFVNDRCLYASNDVGGVSGATGYSFSRASAGYYTNADGTLTSFASGALRRGNRGLLIEGARTNLLQRSQEFDDAYWTKSSATITANASVAPDGTTTADRLTLTANNGRIQRAVTTTSSAVALYVKYVSGSGLFSIDTNGGAAADTVIFNVQTGTVSSTGANNSGSTVEALANGWYRISTVRGATAGGTLYFGLGAGSLSGDVLDIWQADVQAGAFISSPIVTTTASATRAADVLTCTAGVSYPLSLWAEFERAVDTGVGEIIAQIDAGADANRLGIYVTSIDRPQAFVSSSGATQADITIASTIAINTAVKMAARCATNSVNLAYNGTAGTEDTSVTAPSSPTLLRFGSGPASAFPSFGYLRRAAIFNSALSNANLQTVTT